MFVEKGHSFLNRKALHTEVALGLHTHTHSCTHVSNHDTQQLPRPAYARCSVARGGPHARTSRDCVAASVTISSAWSLNHGRLLVLVVPEHYPATVNEMSSSSNASNIALNRQALYQAECRVERNKTQAYLIRSVVEENHDSILKNYHAAFRGNRNLANANTDDLFRNRYAILRSMKIDSANQVQKTISCGVLCFSRQYL